MLNYLLRAGARVANDRDIHVSGHASMEEQKLMLNLVRPRFFVPIHGETRHLVAHAALAQEVGIPKSNVFVLGNGDCLELSKSGARISGSVEHGVVYVDGLGVGDVGQVVLRDRQVLACPVAALAEAEGRWSSGAVHARCTERAARGAGCCENAAMQVRSRNTTGIALTWSPPVARW